MKEKANKPEKDCTKRCLHELPVLLDSPLIEIGYISNIFETFFVFVAKKLFMDEELEFW